MVLGRDFELREYVYNEKMYLSLITILLEDSLCFLLNFYIVFCDSPESVEKHMFHLASWQTPSSDVITREHRCSVWKAALAELSLL